jgi:hypothetical protein
MDLEADLAEEQRGAGDTVPGSSRHPDAGRVPRWASKRRGESDE